MQRILSLVFSAVVAAPLAAGDGNRLAYLDSGCDPYYVHRDFPKLTTPMWVGEDGVEAVVILGIDDMRGHERWEAYLRPILERLKKMDGRAPVSILTCSIDPKHEHLQKWLKEGLSLECHTIDHPCPLLAKGDFAAAKSTYDRCVDLMFSIPGNRPVAFRTPCCDSLNTNSPRMYAEIFNKITPVTSSERVNGHTWKKQGGNFLTIDTSVFNLFTANDPALPRELVLDADGQEKFRKCLPKDRNFVNVIEDYPYPYVIDKLCWEFPCVTPSDWQAQHLHKPNNPITVKDWMAALDCTVIKQGVFCLVFHPHNWIKPEQVSEFIDHAEMKHGKKVKFLTFKEAEERLNKNLLAGQPLRHVNGEDNGVRLLDVDRDGHIDVVLGTDRLRQTRIWSPKNRTWTTTDFPVTLAGADLGGTQRDRGGRFGILSNRGPTTLLIRSLAPSHPAGGWQFTNGQWQQIPGLLEGLETDSRPMRTLGTRLLDLDNNGACELVALDPLVVWSWSGQEKRWCKCKFEVPNILADAKDGSGTRFVDLDADDDLDLLLATETGWGAYLFESIEKGWSRTVASHRPPGARQEVILPPISIKGANNGFFIRNRTLFWQNENTAHLKDLVARVTFDELLKEVQPGPKKPEQSQRCIQVAPGFHVELVAAEPLVQTPIAIAWGPDAKLWVVEMGDYPAGLDGKGKPGGKVKFLEDLDGDGKYDKATVFLDGLWHPTSVMPWKKGVLVTSAPDLFYAEDTDGDGKADKREVLFTGFKRGNPQHLVNGLTWGLDNWIYGANGDSGGVVYSPLRPPSGRLGKEQPVNISGRDFRFRPDTLEFELVTGMSQYGRCRDDWGNWFGGNNSNPLWHFVLADEYLQRNPHFAPPSPRLDVPAQAGHAPVYPISRLLPRFNDYHTANRFTSACSPTIYRDDLFSPHFANNVFICEPVHNLVHREVMRPDGVTFKSHRAPGEERSEFLASTDNWFRPVFAQTGPDGALWVVDAYRHVIEHPEWIPKEWQARLDLRAGHDMGRIYRVYPIDKKPRPMPRMDRLDGVGLAIALASPNGWQRDMAQMQMLWQKGSVAMVDAQALGSKQPLARLHALCTQDGLRLRHAPLLKQMLADDHPAIRRHAVRLSAQFDWSRDKLSEELARLIDDPDPHVRMQLAYVLGEWKDSGPGATLGALALRTGDDKHLRAAVLSSINAQNVENVLTTVLKQPEEAARLGLIEQLLGIAHGYGAKEAVKTLIQLAATPNEGKFQPWQFTAIATWLDALAQRNQSVERLAEETEWQKSIASLSPLLKQAHDNAFDETLPPEKRIQGIRLVGRGLGEDQTATTRLAQLLSAQHAREMQVAALEAIARSRHLQPIPLLMQEWTTKTPALRSQILQVIQRRADWLAQAVMEIDRQAINPAQLDAAFRQRLLQHEDQAIRKRATELLAGAIDKDRQKILDGYKSALAAKGDAQKGRELFAKHCSACHKLDGVGHEVGPDLAALTDKSPNVLLEAILDPSRAVEARYVNFLASTGNGLTYAGVLTQETSSSITLVGPDGKPETILRANLDRLVSTGKSAMPEGLEKDLAPPAMADLLAYLSAPTSNRFSTRKQFALNKPEVVQPGTDGALRLLATAAEIYGPSLVLEDKYRNLGYWSQLEDRAVWTIDVPKAGTYEVRLDYACDPTVAGNVLHLEVGEARVTWPVVATKDWDTYKEVTLGRLELRAGQQRLVARSAGAVREAMLDLRGLQLWPVR